MCRRWQSCPSLLMGNQGGKALKWLPAHFNFCGSMSTSSGHFVPKSGMGRRTGVFIYVLSADETNLALVASRHAITALFSCRFKCPCPPCGNRIFVATSTERITHYTLQAKSCAKGNAPLETPDNKTGWTPRTFPVLDIQPLFVVSSSRFVVCV